MIFLAIEAELTHDKTIAAINEGMSLFSEYLS